MRPWLFIGLLFLPACASAANPAPKAVLAATTTRSTEIAAAPPPETPQQPAAAPPLPFTINQEHLSPADQVAVKRLLEAYAELEKLRRMYPDRYEATFNEAILLQEYAGYFDQPQTERILRHVIELYRLFIRQAGDDPDARGAVMIAQSHVDALDDIFGGFRKETEADRKRREQEEKQQAAEEEILRGEPAASAPKN